MELSNREIAEMIIAAAEESSRDDAERAIRNLLDLLAAGIPVSTEILESIGVRRPIGQPLPTDRKSALSFLFGRSFAHEEAETPSWTSRRSRAGSTRRQPPPATPLPPSPLSAD